MHAVDTHTGRRAAPLNTEWVQYTWKRGCQNCQAPLCVPVARKGPLVLPRAFEKNIKVFVFTRKETTQNVKSSLESRGGDQTLVNTASAINGAVIYPT